MNCVSFAILAKQISHNKSKLSIKVSSLIFGNDDLYYSNIIKSQYIIVKFLDFNNYLNFGYSDKSKFIFYSFIKLIVFNIL